MANLVSPLSKGLFHRAINESGTRIGYTAPATFLQAGKDFAAAAGCPDQSAKCLRTLSVEQLLDHQDTVVRYVPDFPTVDGTVIKDSPLEAFSRGRFNRVPILTGLVADEQAYFLPEATTHKQLTTQEVEKYAGSFGAEHAAALLAKYPPANYASPSLAEIAMAQGAKSCTARLLDRQWAKYVPVYAYEFDDRTAPSYFPELSYPMRAYHTAELQYLFPLFHGGQGMPHPLDDAQRKLSDQLVDYWTAFARTGNPNRGPRRLPPWTRYTADDDDILSLNSPVSKMVEGYGKANDCSLWDAILAYK